MTGKSEIMRMAGEFAHYQGKPFHIYHVDSEAILHFARTRFPGHICAFHGSVITIYPKQWREGYAEAPAI